MKSSTLVSFITICLMSTDAFASALPHDDPHATSTSPLSPSSHHHHLVQRAVQDEPNPVQLWEELMTHSDSNKPTNTRRSRFRKQSISNGGARLPNKAQMSSPRVDPVVPSTPDIDFGKSQRRDMVRKQVPDIGASPEAIANSTLQQIGTPDILSTTEKDPNTIFVSARTTHSSTQDLQEEAPIRTTKRDETDLTDLQYLNYALVIEQLLYAHYLQALHRFSSADFQNAGFPDWVRGRFREMAEHERMHKEFLESAIVAAGSEHVQPANYDFQDQDVHSFIDTSMALESIAASAYIGILQFFNNKAYVTTEAAMLADRARQAAWINSAVRKQNPWNTAFETPLTPQQVFTLLSIFFNDETSPKSNKALLPTGLRPFPRLTLSPRLVPGEQAEISFPSPDSSTKPSFLYVAFMSGVETILGRVQDREERNTDDSGGENVVQRHFVEIPRDLASRGVVYVVVLRGETEEMGDVRMDDGSVVAGPAISTFPFDAGSRPI